METSQQRRVPDHMVHGGLTLVTCGLWLVSWVSMAMVMRGEVWRCTRCRAPQTGRSGVTLAPEPARVAEVRVEPPVSVIRTERMEKVA